MLMCVFLFLLWLIFNGRVTLEICLFGVVVTGLVYAFCVAVLGYHPRNERRVLGRLGWYLQYGATLVWEKMCIRDSAKCGDIMKMYLKIKDGVIELSLIHI